MNQALAFSQQAVLSLGALRLQVQDDKEAARNNDGQNVRPPSGGRHRQSSRNRAVCQELSTLGECMLADSSTAQRRRHCGWAGAPGKSAGDPQSEGQRNSQEIARMHAFILDAPRGTRVVLERLHLEPKWLEPSVAF